MQRICSQSGSENSAAAIRNLAIGMTCQTIMGTLNRRLFTTSGEIVFTGRELLSLHPQKQREIYGAQIALIPQNPMTALDPSARVGRQMRETLFLHTGRKGTDADERLVIALHQAGLGNPETVLRCYPYMLSGGMLQRVLIAMILAVFLMTRMMGGKNADFFTRYQLALEDMSGHAVEYVRGIPVVKVFQQTVYSFKSFYQSIMS